MAKKIAAHWYEPDGSDRGPWTRKVAAALRLDAKGFRLERNYEGARALEAAARSLDQVADGKSYASAFRWPSQDVKP